MNFRLPMMMIVSVLVTTAVASGWYPPDEKKLADPAFKFNRTAYFHRFTHDDMREYTPAGQEDLSKWTDMMTIHRYPTVKTDDDLAKLANNILELYKKNRAIVVRADSVPKKDDKPAEHLAIVVMGEPGFLEAVFARIKMHEGVGGAAIYCHRIYGKRVGNEMSPWLEKNGPNVEKALMRWDQMPKSRKTEESEK